jgi:hypothetical protein
MNKTTRSQLPQSHVGDLSPFFGNMILQNLIKKYKPFLYVKQIRTLLNQKKFEAALINFAINLQSHAEKSRRS